MIVKETDVDFIGSIPVHWEVVPVKYFSTFRMGQTILKEDLIENGKFPVYSATEKDHYFGSINNPQFILDEGDIVIPARGNSIGHIKLVHEKAVSTQTTIANFVDQNKVSSKFLFYFYKAFRENLFPYDNTAIPQITVEKIKDNKVALPPISEQTHIADFLDRKTAQIDEIIAKKEKMLALLDEKKKAVINEAVTKGLNPNAKMKDSGIEWIGEIPENWEVSKIKFCSGIQGRIGFKGYAKDDIVGEEEGALTLGAKHINKQNELDLSSPEYLSWEKYYESPEIMVYEGDIIFTQRGSLGKVCLIKNDIGDATINPSMVILRAYDNINKEFLYNWLTADYIQNNVSLIQSNTAVPMISQFQLGNFEILKPTLEEQHQINEFVIRSKENFNTLIHKIELQIEKLKEYRQSIISEAVTGKIDVKKL